MSVFLSNTSSLLCLYNILSHVQYCVTLFLFYIVLFSKSNAMASRDESNLKRAVQSSTGSTPNLTNMVSQTALFGGSPPRQAGTSTRRGYTDTKLSVEAQGDFSPEHYEPTIFFRHSVSWPSLPTLPYDSFAPPATIYSPPPSLSPSVIAGNSLLGEPALLPTEAFTPLGNASPQPRTSTPTTEDVLSSPLPPLLECSLQPPLIPCVPSSSPQQPSASGASLSFPPPIPSKTASRQSVAQNLPQRRSYPELPSPVDVNERPQNRYRDMSSPQSQPLEKVLTEEKDPNDKDVLTMENMFEALAVSFFLQFFLNPLKNGLRPLYMFLKCSPLWVSALILKYDCQCTINYLRK